MCRCHYSNKKSNLQDEETVEPPWMLLPTKQILKWPSEGAEALQDEQTQGPEWGAADPQRVQRHHRMNRPRVQSEEPLREGHLCAHKIFNISENIQGFESISVNMTWVYVHSSIILLFLIFLNEQVVTMLILKKLE